MLLLLLSACSGKPAAGDSAANTHDTATNSDTDTDSDTDSDTDADSDTDTDADSGAALADIRDTMTTTSEGCDTLGGDAVDGAREYFWGEYHLQSGTSWTGEESIYYYANATWKSHGGADCVVFWTMTGTDTPSDLSNCATCELGLSVSATVDTTTTTCPSSLYSGSDTWASDYALDLATDGTSTWYFTGSGHTMGTGYWVTGGANFLSASCAWF